MNQSSAPAPVVQRSALAPRSSAIALARLRDLALLPALAVLLIIGSVISPVFLTSGNINTILTSSAALALVVLAESLVIITGKFDLSLGVLLLGVVGNLLTLAQVPSFWIQAIYGAIILGSLMVARFAGGQSQE